jgi:hypothetical protein
MQGEKILQEQIEETGAHTLDIKKSKARPLYLSAQTGW